MALRLNSATVSVTRKRGNARFGFPGAFSGLVFLFDTETNELISVLQDFYLNPIRVAATSAVVTARLARDDAKVMGLFGSGTQATPEVAGTSATLTTTPAGARFALRQSDNSLRILEVPPLPRPGQMGTSVGMVGLSRI